MQQQTILRAFSEKERILAHELLATRVAFMMGRKFEEDDWASVYCAARGIEKTGWSNLNIDISYNNQGIEQKMLCIRNLNILSSCGCTFMHPSATRSIRIPSLNIDANEAMFDIITQYADFLRMRSERIKATGHGEPDMRTGWLLWQVDLREFLYFEEKTQIPDPNDYFAVWEEKPSRGVRKGSKNLWVYEKETGKKRFSITTSAGAKIQPYFDVPPIGSANLYHFVVIGEHIEANGVRMWVTDSTYHNLFLLLEGDLSKETLSRIILESAKELHNDSFARTYNYEKAHELIVSTDAYEAIQSVFPCVNDDSSMQLLVAYLLSKKQ